MCSEQSSHLEASCTLTTTTSLFYSQWSHRAQHDIVLNVYMDWQTLRSGFEDWQQWTDHHNTLTANFNLIYFPLFLLCWHFSLSNSSSSSSTGDKEMCLIHQLLLNDNFMQRAGKKWRRKPSYVSSLHTNLPLISHFPPLCSLKGCCRRGAHIKRSGSALIELMSTYAHLLIYNIYRHMQPVGGGNHQILARWHGRQAQWTNGSGFKKHRHIDIISTPCVWQNNDPLLIQMHVAYGVENIDILKELKSLSQSSSRCLCFCVKADFDTDQSHRLVTVTGLESSLTSEQLKNILRSSLSTLSCCDTPKEVHWYSFSLAWWGSVSCHLKDYY